MDEGEESRWNIVRPKRRRCFFFFSSSSPPLNPFFFFFSPFPIIAMELDFIIHRGFSHIYVL